MKLILCDEKYRYDAESICSLFLPHERLELAEEPDDGDFIRITADIITAAAEVRLGGRELSRAEIVSDEDDNLKHCAARALYKALRDITGVGPGWGILTGVRPAKLMRRLIQTRGLKEAERILKEKMLVSEEKIALCQSVSEHEGKIIDMSNDRDFSLYISIPFCPTRCSYCSFVSHTVQRAGDLIPEYLHKLMIELEKVSEISRALCLNLRTIYIGGGTPAVLTPQQLDMLMGKISKLFNIPQAAEYTVEAGRPDVTTLEKLRIIKENGAARVSINPQTMNDDVLDAIGRCHTSAQTLSAFEAARQASLAINMDLIAGLPTESYESFARGMDIVKGLSPENITVHTLALKRAAGLEYKYGEAEGEQAGKMVEYAYNSATSSGYMPYYMYRQKRSPGNHENVGYARPGFDGLYNVFIMDETHTILSVGASAVTKLVSRDGKSIQRIFNFKYPYEYINRFDEIIDRKQKVTEFYESDYI